VLAPAPEGSLPVPCLAAAGRARRRLTLHLGLVDEEVFGGAAALELLAGAPLGAELLVLALVQGEERGGEAAAAGGPGQGRQRELLRGRADGGQPAAPSPSPMADPSSAPCAHPGRAARGGSQHPPSWPQHPSSRLHKQLAADTQKPPEQCSGHWHSLGTSFVSLPLMPRLPRAHGQPCGSLTGVSELGIPSIYCQAAAARG